MNLFVKGNILEKIGQVFSSSDVEQGFLLGCTTRLDCLDYCEQVPAVRAGIHFYEPDATCANEIIQSWAKRGICFCGFIHSHVVDKEDLSEADEEFARSLSGAYDIPVMWFGLGVVNCQSVSFSFYSVSVENDKNMIASVNWTEDNVT